MWVSRDSETNALYFSNKLRNTVHRFNSFKIRQLGADTRGQRTMPLKYYEVIQEKMVELFGNGYDYKNGLTFWTMSQERSKLVDGTFAKLDKQAQVDDKKLVEELQDKRKLFTSGIHLLCQKCHNSFPSSFYDRSVVITL